MASNGDPNGSADEILHTELESILRDQRNRGVVDRDRDRDLNIYRSGSAPPTVEGSLTAVGGLFGANDFRAFGVGANEDDEFRSHPDYLSFYYSHDNVNPRLPPPSLSREDWRVARRFSGAAGSGSSSSLFSMQPDPVNARRTHAPQADWPFERGSDGFGTSPAAGGGGLGVRRKSFADILQEGADRPASSNFLSRPSSRNSFSEDVELLGALRNGVAPLDLSGIQSQGAAVPYPLSSVPGLSLSRNTTPEPKLVGRSPGSGLPPVGSRVEQKNFRAFNPQSGYSSEMNELADIAANLSGLSVSKFRDRDMNSHGQSKLSLDGNSEFLFKSGYGESLQREFIDNSETDSLSAAFNYNDLARMNGTVNNMSASKRSSNMHASFPRRTSSSANLYSQVGSSGFGSLDGQNAYYQNATTDFIPGSFPANHNQNSAIDSHLDTVLNSIQNGHMNNLGNKAGPDLHSPLSDPRYVQFLQRNPDYATRAANSLTDLSLVKNQFSTSHGELEGFQKAYIERLLLAQQREQLELSLLGKSSGYNSIGSYGPSSPYQGNTIGNSVLPNVAGSPLFQSERVSRYSSMMRNSMPMGRSTVSINSEISNSPEGKITSSILDEFKNNKIKSYELPDIVGHVVEFSMDQYGSRFIQQKLETATAEEKAIIFPEIIPLAHGLMTDVFGNYVIQKFFEHGTESQRKELANQLTGHVLPLSLQMYGCRVIQKALEVVGLDQQTQMVAELDGSIMKCVRDQNGNHVIQKCIECVPQECIQFIITAFYGQVVVLSTHPYGCRVIQRVLEHCDDSNTQQIIMNEIMQSVCTLAQDQYGNYVIQHVLQHGNPQERSTIIYKLAGQIVRMSQQKFASNVVEKCLTFGTPDERQILVNEMLGSTDENEPLQAMMKDPFGNYVVQKVLETCNDESLELLLSRIKVHLNTLKRFTYGKHIVSRIEKLVATGERRIGLSSTISS